MTIELPKRLDGNKWKLLYYGDLGATTGFNNISRNILDNLYKTGLFDITVLAVNNWGEPDPDQRRYTIFPAGNNNSPKKDPYGASRFQEILMKKNVEFDIVFILQDTFVVSSYLEELMEKSKRVLNNKFVSIFYFPIDGIPGQQWIKAASAVDCPVTYTKFGHELCSKVYPPIARKLNVIPHGVNPEDFYPLPKEFSRDFRREVFKTVPDIDNKFIFFRVDRNQPRKDYPRLLIAFKEFLRKHPGEAILYCHCMPRDPLGHNLYDTCNNIGLRDGIDIFFPNKLDVKNGYPTSVINKLYSMADCYITNSLGGGWELCLHPESKVKTDVGFKEIQDIQIGDNVLTRKGMKPVINVANKEVDEEIVCVTADKRSIIEPLKLTKEHPVLTKRGWLKAGELTLKDEVYYYTEQYEYTGQKSHNDAFIDIYKYCKDKLNLCVTEKEVWLYASKKTSCLNRYIRLNKEFSELYGLYLAEGSSDRSGIVFSLSSKEEDIRDRIVYLMNSIFGMDSPRIEVRGSKMWVRFFSKILKRLFVELAGSGSKNKSIKLLPNLTKQTASKVLKGIWLGDGSTESGGYEITTASRKLALDVLYLGDLLGIRFGFECLKRVSKFKSSRGKVLTHYRLRTGKAGESLFYNILNASQVNGEKIKFNKIKLKSNYDAITKFSPTFIKIKDISYERYKGLVHDISVEDCHEFMTDHCLVHNCNTESFATKTPIIGPRNTSFIELIGENEERGYLANSGNNFNNYVSLINDLGVIRPLTDLSSLVAKMEYVFNNREEAAEKAEAAYEWVINNLTWEKGVMPRWFSLFSQAMKALNAQKYALMVPGSQGQTPTRAFIF